MIRNTNMRIFPLVVLLATAMVTRPANAGDLNPPAGPVAGTMKTLAEVEPRIAVNATNTPGDADSLYKITQPGSYYLTGNVAGVAGEHGIEIAANGVTLDLNGFDLLGVPGSLNGVVAGNQFNITVVNGSVRSWGFMGVNLSSNNAFGGHVARVLAENNGSAGIAVYTAFTVSDCVARGNGSYGIYMSDSCTISGCVAENNTSFGIYAFLGCTISNCSVGYNVGGGVRANHRCQMTGCVAHDNGGDNIYVDSHCVVRGNTCVFANLHAVGSRNRIEENLCTGASKGLVIDTGNNYIADNIVYGNTDNYDIAAGNQLNLLLGQIPESIDWPATVKLAGDLTGVSGSNGITIAADNVSIDLDGHALVGVGGSLDGINVSGSRRNIAVRNGTARNWAGDGIDAASAGNSRFDDLRLSSNTGDGLRVGVDCAVRACSALSNGGDGIEGGGNGTIIECFANANTMTGILAGDSTIVTNCEAAFNSGDGIRVATGSSVRHCTVRGSVGDGIEGGTSCTIAENQTDLCGNGGSGAGVHITGSGCRVEGNTCLSADRGVDVDGTGNLIIRNTARSNTTNFDIVAGNRYGPIIDITAGGTAAVSGNSAASTMSSTDPWANFAH